MRSFRFSISALLAVVLFVAIAVAALRATDDAWDSALVGLVLIALPTAGLLAIHRNGSSRAYWLGFVLCGATYFGVSLIPPLEPRLPTSKGMAYLESKVSSHQDNDINARRHAAVAFSPDGRRLELDGPSQGAGWIWDVSTGRLLAGSSGSAANFVRIGHSLLTLLLAFLGGLLSRSLYERRRGPAEPA